MRVGPIVWVLRAACLAACGAPGTLERPTAAPSGSAGAAATASELAGSVDLSRLRVGAPRPIGPLVGAGAQPFPLTSQIAGSDLGWTFAHRDRLTVLFGDTMLHPRFYCEQPAPIEDDTIASLPLSYAGGLPRLEFITRESSVATIRVIKGGQALSMGAFRTPLTGWSDGAHAYALFGRVEY